MSESIYKNNELENEVSLDLSFFGIQMLTSIYFTCQQSRGSHNPLTESYNGLNVSQLHMRLGQHSVILKLHHNNS